MSNSYYNYSGNFIPGTLARAETVSAEFNSVAQGFSKLSVQGVDTGTVNHVIFSTTGYPVAAYNDGNNLQFRVLFTNTGPTDINVNGIGAVPLLRFNGAPLVAGDLSAGSWYIAIYEAAFGGFTILSPAAYATFAGTISQSAPSNKVGLTAAGGSSTAAAPIDVTFALDQSIVPTWTGIHTFDAGATINWGNSLGPVLVVNQLTAGWPSASFNASIQVFGNSVAHANQNVGVSQIYLHGGFAEMVSIIASAGTDAKVWSNYADPAGVYYFRLENDALTATTNWLSVTRTGIASAVMAFTGQVNVSPVSGVSQLSTFTSTGAFANVSVVSPVSVGSYYTATVTSFGSVLMGVNGNAGADSNGFLAHHVGIGTPSNLALDITTNAIQRIQVGAAGAVSVNAPASGVALTVTGIAGASAAQFLTTGVQIGSPTGGDKGSGTLNVASGLYINNVAVVAGTGAGGVSSIAGTANQIAVSASTGAVTLSMPNNVVIPTPASGLALALANASGATAIGITMVGGGAALGAFSAAATSVTVVSINQSGQTSWSLYQPASSSDLRFFAGTDRVVFAAAGNVTINAPTSGVALSLTGVTSSAVVLATTGGSGTAFQANGAAATQLNALSVNQSGQTAWTLLQAASVSTLSLFGGTTVCTWTNSGGQQLGAPTGGDQGAGTLNATGLFVNGAPVYSGIPQNSKSAAYTTVLADANKHIYHPSADTTARIWTIDSNANVPYPIGTAITFDNDISAGVITLSITTDTLVWLPTGGTGNRSIAAGGQGTALKVTATRWHLTGVGIT